MVLSRTTQLEWCKNLVREQHVWSIALRAANKFRSGSAQGSSVILEVQMVFHSLRGSASCVGDKFPVLWTWLQVTVHLIYSAPWSEVTSF